MKKTKKRSVNIDGVVIGVNGAENLGLEHPYSSAPNHGMTYCLAMSKGSKHWVFGYRTAYATRKLLDILLEDDELAISQDVLGVKRIVRSSTGIEVKFYNEKDLDFLLNYKYNKAEEQWQLEQPDINQALRIRNASTDIEPIREVSDDKPSSKKESPAKAIKISKDNLVSVASIAEELKIEPKDARSILRKAKVTKPAEGWWFNQSDVDKIKKILHDNK